MSNKLLLYKVIPKYNRNLANQDDNVLSNSHQIGKETRPYIGVLVLINDKLYCAPITSPKPKHNTMPKNFDYLKVFDNDKLIAVINFNNMIPVCPSVIEKIDVLSKKNDPPAVKSYKNLLAKELDWCQKNQELVQKNAQKTYDAVTSGKGSRNLINRSCNFKKLEKILEKWITNEFDKCSEVLNANPKLKADLNAAAAEFYRVHNLPPLDSSASITERYEMRIKILEAIPKLKAEFTKAENKYEMKKDQSQQQSKPKPKHRR